MIRATNRGTNPGGWFSQPELSGGGASNAAAIEPFRRRVQDTVLKSIREAKRRTSWSNPNEAYEGACLRFVERVLDVDRPNPFLDDFLAFEGRIAQLGMLNSLSQTVLALTAPGVPDIYQGGGSWDLNMVDPDNRRPVDFALRRRMLDEILQTGGDRRERIREWLAAWPDGRIKLAVVSALLRCRRTSSGLFAHAGYEPMNIQGPHAHHVVAFARRDGGQTCVVVAARLFARLLEDEASYRGAVWGDSLLELPDAPDPVTNILTGETMRSGAGLRLSALLADLPAAVLLAQS